MLLALVPLLTCFSNADAADAEAGCEEPRFLVQAAFYQIPEGAKLSRDSPVNRLEGAHSLVGGLSPAESERLGTELSRTAGVDRLSAPSVIIRSGQKAVIEIGREQANPKGEKFEPVRLGVTLGVIARGAANDPGIELELNPVLRELDETVSPPTVIEQKVATKLKVWNGQTLLLSLGTHGTKSTLQETIGTRSKTTNKEVMVQTIVAITASAVDDQGRPVAPGAGVEAPSQPIVRPGVESREAGRDIDAREEPGAQSRKLDASKNGVNLILKAAGNSSLVTMALRNVTVAEALRQGAAISGSRLTVEKDTFVITPAEK